MPKRQPLLIRSVNKVDSVLAPALESLVRSEAAGLGLMVVTRLQRGVTARAERASRRILHGLNLPAGSDIRRLLVQMAMVEREVRELGKAIDDSQSPHDSSGPWDLP